MKRIKLDLHKRMEQIKIWQEECKLLLMILGCISAVAVFVTNLWHGKVAAPALGEVAEGIKSLGAGGGGIAEALPKLSVAAAPQHHAPIFMYANVVVIVLLVGFVIYFGIKVLNKRRTPKS